MRQGLLGRSVPHLHTLVVGGNGSAIHWGIDRTNYLLIKHSSLQLGVEQHSLGEGLMKLQAARGWGSVESTRGPAWKEGAV
jgi:hypothetical protein